MLILTIIKNVLILTKRVKDIAEKSDS